MQLELPLATSRSAPPPRSPMVRALFDAGSHTRRTRGWQAPTASPNTAVLWDLTTLRDRSRAAVRNDGFAKGSIDILVTNIIGWGIKPLSQALEKEFRESVHLLWNLWVDESDADGLLSFYGQQSQAVRCWLEAGEVFIRIRQRRPSDGLSVPLQVQVIEPELCPHTELRDLPNGNRVRAGIEKNGIGRTVAYWFYRFRPGDFDEYDKGDLVRVPAESVIHLFDPLRAGQLRGVPYLTQALIKLYELDKYDDATLLRQQLANLFAGFLEQGVTPDGESSFNPLTGLAADTTQDERPVVSLEPGLMQELAAGEKITFSDPPDPPSTYPQFMKQQLRAVAAATGVPYELLTGDLSGLNDRIMRVILGEFRRKVQAYQHGFVSHQLCGRVWGAWLDEAVANAALPVSMAEYQAEREPLSSVRWMPQGWPYLHPVQDVQATNAAIRSGLTTRSAAVSEQGEDSEVIDAEQAADNERADKLGLTYESDARNKATSSPAPAPNPDLDPDEVEERLEDPEAVPEEEAA